MFELGPTIRTIIVLVPAFALTVETITHFYHSLATIPTHVGPSHSEGQTVTCTALTSTLDYLSATMQFEHLLFTKGNFNHRCTSHRQPSKKSHDRTSWHTDQTYWNKTTSK